jgi:hypothetical protein
MRKWLGMLGAVLAAQGAHAMQNEPGDFLGLEWGAALEPRAMDFKPITVDANSGHYRRSADRPIYAGMEVRRISYYFYKGRFSSGTFLTVGTTDLKNIIAHLTERYGAPVTVNARHRVYAWEGDKAGITVSCDITISCYTEFYDKALRLEELAAQPKDANAKDD